MASKIFLKLPEVSLCYFCIWRVGGKGVVDLFFTRFPTQKCWFPLKVKFQCSIFTCLDIYMLPLILCCALLLFYVLYYMVVYCISKSCSHLLTWWLILLHSLLLWIAFQRDQFYVSSWSPSPHIVLCFICRRTFLHWFLHTLVIYL